MKLQIENQHLRLRVDEAELARLLVGERIEARTRFGQAFSVTFALALTRAESASVAGDPEAWTIEVPYAAVSDHALRLPTREGLRFLLPTGHGGEPLALLFDVDVRDSARRRKAG